MAQSVGARRGGRRRSSRRDLSAKSRFRAGDESKAILKNKMIKELDQEVAAFAGKHGVRFQSPRDGLTDGAETIPQ